MASNTPPVLANPPSINILPDLVSYLLTKTDVSSYFNSNINYYKRKDYSDRQVPALNIFGNSETLNGGIWWLEGEAFIEGILPPQFKREKVTDNVYYATNLLFLYLNGFDLVQTIEPNSPGLRDISTSLTWDFQQSISVNENQKIDAYIIKGTINYRVNLLDYYESLETGDLYDQAAVYVNPISA